MQDATRVGFENVDGTRMGLRLTPDEYDELSRRMFELVEEFRLRGSDRSSLVAVHRPAPGRPAGVKLVLPVPDPCHHRGTMTQPLHDPTPKIEPYEPASRTSRPSRSEPSTSPRVRSTWRTGRRCAGSRASRPSSRTSARSNTGSSGWSGSCWSASGPPAPPTDAELSLAELARLAETAGSQVLDGLMQRREPARPGDLPRLRQGQGGPRHRRGHRRRHRDLRRRADPRPAAQARGDRQGQGHRPDRADPRHLRPARAQPGGQGAGRAGPAAIPAAPAARLGRVAVPAGRRPGRRRWRHRHPRPRRDQDRDRPAPDQLPDRQAAPPAGRAEHHPGHPAAGAGRGTRCRRWCSPATPTPASPRCSTG